MFVDLLLSSGKIPANCSVLSCHWICLDLPGRQQSPQLNTPLKNHGKVEKIIMRPQPMPGILPGFPFVFAACAMPTSSPSDLLLR